MCNNVVHCKRSKFDVYIGRPSKWGNPFSWKTNTLAQFKCKDREDSIKKYEEWIMNNPSLLKDIPELRGKVLGCWCSPDHCHGDVLVKIVKMYCE